MVEVLTHLILRLEFVPLILFVFAVLIVWNLLKVCSGYLTYLAH